MHKQLLQTGNLLGHWYQTSVDVRAFSHIMFNNLSIFVGHG